MRKKFEEVVCVAECASRLSPLSSVRTTAIATAAGSIPAPLSALRRGCCGNNFICSKAKS